MKTLTKILGMTLVATCFSCISTEETIRPSKNYITEKRNINSIEIISTSSSIDIVYYQTNDKPYAEIYASDNVMPYIILKDSNGELTAYYKKGTNIKGENHCHINVYAPNVTQFKTNASGDISIPNGLNTKKDVQLYTQASGNIECPSIECENINIKTNASGDIEMKETVCQNASLSVNASGDISITQMKCKENLDAEINASGDINVSGNSHKATLANRASGDLDAENLITDEINAESYGSGDISCYASKAITAKTYGSGNLIYYGNPAQTNNKGKNIYRK